MTEESNEVAVTKINDEVASEEYAYLDRGGFSSENFKVELRGLPKFYGLAELKKLFKNNLGLNNGKIKCPKVGKPWLYVCFQNDEDRDKAISVLNGYSWKGSTFTAEKAKPAPDPFVRKRKNQQNTGNANDKRKKEDDNKSQEERLKDATTPYWKMPYEEQLQLKFKEIYAFLSKLDNEIWRMNREQRSYIEEKRKIHKLAFEVMPIEKSPITEGYRNKCEFTVGVDEETMLPTVGFRLGSYVKGTIGVAPVQGMIHVSDKTKKAVLLFQNFVRNSNLAPFSPADYSGYWKYLTVRHSTSTGDVMLIVAMCPQDMTEEKLSKVKTDLKEYFSSEEAAECGIKSLYFQLIVKRKSGDDGCEPEHLSGSTHIIDSVLGLNFRISPQAFFQVNTAAADILYQKAIEMSQVNENTVVVDVCCGTGTIGLCFAKHCDKVLGLELVEAAVKDAKANAAHNSVTNCDFFTGRAEEALLTVLARAQGREVVAVVDPPRAGLHTEAVKKLRNTKDIDRLVYISCSPQSVMKNFLDLTRPSSKMMRGEPFVPVTAVPVDMFPNTKHVELAIVFERVKQMKTATSEEKPTETESTRAETLESEATSGTLEVENVNGDTAVDKDIAKNVIESNEIQTSVSVSKV